ncbi:MAG: dihydropteroate synthase [Muribaculaceae bacterium]|nr:dihydropteroate synthase [Muribaculaceae bacterium]
MMQPFKTYSLNLKGRLVTIDRPWVMGIINITPDSFYSGSRVADEQMLVERVKGMLADGVDVIDVGACSTRPGSQSVDAQEEMDRLRWALMAIRRVAPEMIVSVDTYRADVARRCVEEWGADIINDISGGTIDDMMFDTIARLQVPYVLMHMRGTPENMSSLTDYNDVTADVLEWMAHRIDELRQMGVADIIADPGFGFAKTMKQNYEMLARLEVFHALDAPLLVGVSRKRMIYMPLECTADEALMGTTVINTIALMQGAHILRVHDVKAAVEAVKLVSLTRDNGPLDNGQTMF